jgi:hypothetical protein
LLSGRPSVRFLQRCRIKKPREYQTSNLAKDSLFYGSEDLFVGAIVKFNDHSFLITEADDYVFSFMERYEEREKVIHCNSKLFRQYPHFTKPMAELIRFCEFESVVHGFESRT